MQLDQDVVKLQLLLTTAETEIKPSWNNRAVVKLQLTSIDVVKMPKGTTRKFKRHPSHMTLKYCDLEKM